MTSDSTLAEVERVVRRSEVLAVVRVLRSDRTPRIGDALDYFLEAGPKNHAGKPYRFAVERWHLDAAAQMVLADATSAAVP